MKIRIIGTEEECLVASDRIARWFDVRSMPRPTYVEEESGRSHFRVQFEARLREDDRQD